jgi:hypothetical protein
MIWLELLNMRIIKPTSCTTYFHITVLSHYTSTCFRPICGPSSGASKLYMWQLVCVYLSWLLAKTYTYQLSRINRIFLNLMHTWILRAPRFWRSLKQKKVSSRFWYAPFLQPPHAHMTTDWIILDVTSALKSDDTPRADDSYQHCEPGLRLKSARASDVETWKVLIPICLVV